MSEAKKRVLAELDRRAMLSPRPAAPSREAVAVKPLEWREGHNQAWASDPNGLIYNIVWGGTRDYELYCRKSRIGFYKTLDEAKAAAQADYEARILSCLTTPPDTAALLEKAADILSAFDSAYSDYRFSPENSWEQAEASRRLENAHTAARRALSDIRKARS